MVIKGGYCIGGQPSSRHQRETNVPAGTLALVRSPQALRCSKEQNALHTLIHQRHLTPSCGGHAPTAERTLNPAMMFVESLIPGPELENGLGHSRPSGTSGISSHVRYASDRYRNSEPLKPTRRAITELMPPQQKASVAVGTRVSSRAPRTGRVEDWRAGLGRCSCSLLCRPFVCECHSISTMPRFQSPPRRTQRADFPLYALLFASPQGLWDLSCRGDFRP